MVATQSMVPVFTNFFYLFQNIYKEAWDKVKATSYNLPTSTLSLTHAKNQKHLASHVSQVQASQPPLTLCSLPLNTKKSPGCSDVAKKHPNTPRGVWQKTSNSLASKSLLIAFSWGAVVPGESRLPARRTQVQLFRLPVCR